MLGSESAIEGASAEESGGRIALVDSEGSNMVAIVALRQLYTAAIETFVKASLSDRMMVVRSKCLMFTLALSP